MADKPEVSIGFGGIRDGIRDFNDLRTAISGTTEGVARLGNSARGLQSLWKDADKAAGTWSNMTRTSVRFVKMAAEVAQAQASAAASAITGPGKTTYEQALSGYRTYRDGVQRMATATGESFSSVDKRIMDTSKRLGVLPGQVQAYGQSIRNVTGGSMETALSGMDAAREESMKTGQSIEAVSSTMLRLRQNFGVTSTQEVNQFFGNLDNQAKSARVTAEVARTAWEANASTLSRITSLSAQAQSSFTTQIAGNTQAVGGTPEMGIENAGEISGFIRNKQYLIEQVLRKKGMLSKGQHIIDASGRLTPEGFGKGMVAARDVMGDLYGRKDPIAAAMKAELSSEMSSGAYLQLNKFDYGKWSAESNRKANVPMNASENWVMSDAGKRAAADAQKNRRDLGLGATMIGAQDAAVGLSGGAAGVAMAAAGGIFSKSVDIFGGAVDRFIGGLGRGGGSAAAGAAGSAAGAATKTGIAARTAATFGGGAVLGLAGGALMLSGDPIPGSQSEAADQAHRRKELEGAKRRLAQMQVPASGPLGWLSKPWGSIEDQKKHVAELQAQVNAGQGIDYDKMAQANAKAQAGQVMKVQLVDAPQAPPGPWAPP